MDDIIYYGKFLLECVFPPLLFTWRHFRDVTFLPPSWPAPRGVWAIHANCGGLGRRKASTREPARKEPWIRKSSSSRPRRTPSLSASWWVPRRMAPWGFVCTKTNPTQNPAPVRTRGHASPDRYDPRNRCPGVWKGCWGHWKAPHRGK